MCGDDLEKPALHVWRMRVLEMSGVLGRTVLLAQVLEVSLELLAVGTARPVLQRVVLLPAASQTALEVPHLMHRISEVALLEVAGVVVSLPWRGLLLDSEVVHIGSLIAMVPQMSGV